MTEVTASPPLWVHLLNVVVTFLIFLLTTALLIWAERRLVAKMQSRLGPNRVGPFGILQTLVDGVKMFFKEDVTPSMVDKAVYGIAPLVSVVVGFVSIAIVPFGGIVTVGDTTFRLQAADPNIGVLWFLAMGSIHVYGIVLAGWASQSPYPLMGGVRSSAQMISYEIAQGLAVASVFIYAGTLQVSSIVDQQANQALLTGVPNWFALALFPAFLVFAIGMVAEAGRPPFDLAEAEGELVAGFHTEYSGMKFAMFMLAEFLNVVTMSAVVVTLFFGGPDGPVFGPGWLQTWVLPTFWFLLKMSIFIFMFVLLRATLPRFRYDRLMDLGWKVLIPLGLVWALATAAIVVAAQPADGVGPWWIMLIGFGVGVGGYALAPVLTRQKVGPTALADAGSERVEPPSTPTREEVTT